MNQTRQRAFTRLKNLGTLPLRAKRTQVGQTPASVVHHENKWRLLRYHARPEGLAYKTPLLLIPSLINRHYVLDLMRGKSFVEFLVARGHDVYIIDWGTPGDEDRYLEWDTVCDKYIGRAVRKAAKLSQTEGVNLLGYCLGGTLATMYTARRPEHVNSLLALAAPVVFGTGSGALLETWMGLDSFDLDALVDASGNVPWPLMQVAFHLLKPTMNLSKATYMVDRAWDDEFLDGFFAIETWGNDNVSFPGACYKRYIQELYRENRLAKGTFRMSGKLLDLGEITCPTLAICFKHDHIVPLESAAPLGDLIGSTNKEVRVKSGGHVGAVVSRKASVGLWPEMAQWFESL